MRIPPAPLLFDDLPHLAKGGPLGGELSENTKEEEEFARLLKDRYAVELHNVAECAVTEELAVYADGYNSTSERLLEKYGKDIFAECRQLSHTAVGR